MLRIEEADSWKVITHRDHALVAGALAQEWGGAFVVPDGLGGVMEAARRHEVGWSERDAEPQITYAGGPLAYSSQALKEEVPFEGLGFFDYLEVREVSANRLQDDPFAACLVSLQTVTTLSKEMDLSDLSDREHQLLAAFLEKERTRQTNLLDSLKADKRFAGQEVASVLEHGRGLLQACDRLSQLVCLRFSNPVSLGDALPMVSGGEEAVWCEPLGADRYRLIPYPFREPQLQLQVPFQRLAGKTFNNHKAIQKAIADAPVEHRTVSFL